MRPIQATAAASTRSPPQAPAGRAVSPSQTKTQDRPIGTQTDGAAITDQWIESCLEQAQDSLGTHLGLCEHGKTSLLHDLQFSQLSRL
jgi:hypothetical protein